MIPHKSMIRHDPAAGKWGDCLRVSVAALLDISHVQSVPHFCDNGIDGDAAFAALHAWLKRLGMVPITTHMCGELSLSDVLYCVGQFNADTPYLLIGDNGDGPHVIICKGDKVWHDVALIKFSDFQACEDSDWLLIFIGVALNGKVLD